MNKNGLSSVEIGLMVALVVVNFQRSRPIDAEHAKAATLFRLIVTAVCVLGFIAVQVLKRVRAKPTPATVPAGTTTIEPADTHRPAGDRAFSVTYRSTPEATWRCNLYVLFHRRSSPILISCISLIAAFFMAQKLSEFDETMAIAAFPVLFLVAVCGWVALILLTLRLQISQRFPSPATVRVCTSTLLTTGFKDVTPDKVHFFEWSSVTAVRERLGDIYVWSKSGGSFIPRTAFADHEAARRYHRFALTLWKSGGAVWPEESAPSPLSERSSRPSSAWSSSRADEENPYAAPMTIADDAPRSHSDGTLPIIVFFAGIFSLLCLVSFLFWRLR